MKKLIFAILLGVSFNNNSLADWTRLGAGENLSDLYIDIDTVRRKGDKAKVWTMEDLKTSNGMYLSNKIQWELDCKEVERILKKVCA